jgi:hypothetical protein
MRSYASMVLGVGLVVAVAAVPVVAHHSFAAEFDAAQPVTIRGKVTKISWTNPHVWIYLNVADEKTGKVENWGFEMGAPQQVRARGWDRDTLKTGDELIVDGSKARDGSLRMNARNVTWAKTGVKLGAASSEGAPAAAPGAP